MPLVSTTINVIDEEELAERVSEKCNYSKETIVMIWDLMLKEVKKSTDSGEKIELGKGVRLVFGCE
ncbi:hypothetical protein NE683_19935 [Bariatricus massiliensis]|uniref:Uncharacterized protein n=1 Tax=Bariatricus massiliensis TaxID=1745713 RepID=A0ABS8DM55_9FIRM|nr:HU family DNA-binding protein [Bariatricus massiliensis]MCB7306363.1 hypothetical protein [Bariatricus massiliensis]MCB7376871.1 hypothetical protein [Bariatricus massiliensis]MCB7389538.1 hypothetical protein [Bariatricus massiliensis]MCB7413695.1 hypothetical protein [Bariatricus massiliensis]MCQ5255492.1 hypothetical protein [Bariatricus massiliensis]